MVPLWQFKGVPAEVTRKAEGKQFMSDNLVCLKCCRLQQPWSRYFDLVGFFCCFALLANTLSRNCRKLIGIPNARRLVHQLVHSFLKLQYIFPSEVSIYITYLVCQTTMTKPQFLRRKL